MRHPRSIVAALTALVLTSMTMTGCSKGDEKEPSAKDDTASSSAAQRLAGWKVVTENLNTFQARVNANFEASTPEEIPDGADPKAVAAAVGFSATDGAQLASYGGDTATGTKICVSGPHDTYAASWAREEGFTRTLGTGRCSYTDGDIVISPSRAVATGTDDSMMFVTTRYAEGIGQLVEDYTAEQGTPPPAIDATFLATGKITMFDGGTVTGYTPNRTGGYHFCVVARDGAYTTYAKRDATTPGAVAAKGSDRACAYDQAEADAPRLDEKPSDFAGGPFEQTITKGRELAGKLPGLAENPLVEAPARD